MTVPFRAVFSLLLATSLSAQEPALKSPAGSVRFGNGDRLTGEALGINDEGNLLWNSEILHDEVPLRIDQIVELSLRGIELPTPDSAHIARLTLSNGDTVQGELTELDDQQVSLKMDHGGLLHIRRGMCSRIDITKSERVLYTGPFEIGRWTIADGISTAWELQEGHLTSRKGASIAREFDLPEKSRLSFQISWRSSLRLRLLLRSNDGSKTQPSNCYDFVYNRRFVYLRKRWTSPNAPGSRIIGQSANIQTLSEKETARFDFYLDNTTGTIALYVDGKQAQVWKDEKPKEGALGNWVHFISEQGYPVQISRIELSEWSSGKLPDDRGIDGPREEIEEDGQRIHLQNGDILVGEVGKITDGVLDVTTAHAPIKVPIGRMSSLMVTQKSDPLYEEPKRMRGDVRAWLRSGGRLTFQIGSFSDGKMTGKSQTFGEATFDLNAFSRVEFNIYNEDFRALRQGSAW